MKKKWVVVAESHHARIYSVESRTAPLKEVDDVANGASRRKGDAQFVEDGDRTVDRHGLDGRHAKEPRIEPKQAEIMHFAHDLGERLENARRVGDYNDLVLISSPGFLGMLKQHLSSVTQKHISKTINKNLTDKSESEIRHYLFH